MKGSRFILINIILLISVVTSQAQLEDSRKEGKHFIGIKAGQNYSWIRLDPRVQQNGLIGSVFGISYQYKPQFYGGIILEAQYIEFGWEEVFPDSTNSYSRKLSYLEFPVLSNFIIGKKKTHFKLLAGVKLDILLDDVENSDVKESAVQYYNGLRIEDTFELGLAFGASLSQSFSFGEIQFDVRFNTALSNLFTASDDLTLLYSQNQGIAGTLSYWFKIK